MIAAIGAFDGFHRGHQILLSSAAEIAAQAGDEWGVMTFSREDGRVLGQKGVRSLFTSREQRVLERYFRIPRVCSVDFTDHIANMSPEEFLSYAATRYDIRGWTAGENFRFGRGRAGDASVLSAYCSRMGWPCKISDMIVERSGETISSSSVRRAVASGDLRRARELLGHPYFFIGSVVHGDGRGRGLGFPTANISTCADRTEMRSGVYATIVRAGGEWHPGAANIGVNPTFGDGTEARFEVHISNYAGDLYDVDIAVFMIDHIRDEMRFDSADALRERIAADAREINDICSRELMASSQLWSDMAEALHLGADML